MTGFALTLVLSAAFFHASWNYLLKKAGGGMAFVWLFAVLSTLIYAPLAIGILIIQKPVMGAAQLVFILGSAALHTVYYLMLARGYRSGDLSLVYPLARGTGPMIATIAAVLFLGENPSLIAIAGAISICVGIFMLTGDPRKLRESGNHRAVGFALITGTMIASYTLWDKLAVSAFLIPPIVMDWGTNLGRTLMLTPMALRDTEKIKTEWRLHKLQAIGVAVLCPLSYILVLTALVFSPVSYVAPAREISILIAALMGTHLLSEGGGTRRHLAAAAMVLGVIALAIG